MEKKEFDKLHAKIRKSMVRIWTILPNQAVAIFPGTIILSGNNFCYVIAHRAAFLGGPDTKYKIIFPDNQERNIELNPKDVKMAKSIVGFFIFNEIEFDDKMVKAVDFNEAQVLVNEEVYTLCFHERAILPSFLAKGRINLADQYQFVHDCSGHLFATYGSPVFNVKGSFAGITYNNECGALVALDIKAVKQILWAFYPETKDQELHELLLNLKAKGEALQ